ncbi:MAG TPA: hypothetical protein VGP84_04710 [Gemmatimonadaceae bacterium]|jgi:hypothetical protein|nr:hypothetical protein [Gemmatimonadaceae bacterium]
MHLRCSVLLLLLVGASRAEGQQRPDSLPHGWLYGVSLGIPNYEGRVVPDLLSFGANFTDIHPNRLGADFAIGTMPYYFAQQILPVGARAGVALPVPLASTSPLLVIPSAGLSALAAAGAGGGGGTVGFNAGIATVIYSGGLGFRAGLTSNYFRHLGWRPLWLFEVGFVVVPVKSP